MWPELGVRWNHAEPLLVFKDFIAQLFPAVVEQVHGVDFINPSLRRLVRRVSAAGNQIDKERLGGRGRVQRVHILDGIVRQVDGEVVIFSANPRINLGVVLKQIGRPLVGLATHESVKIIEAHP